MRSSVPESSKQIMRIVATMLLTLATVRAADTETIAMSSLQLKIPEKWQVHRVPAERYRRIYERQAKRYQESLKRYEKHKDKRRKPVPPVPFDETKKFGFDFNDEVYFSGNVRTGKDWSEMVRAMRKRTETSVAGMKLWNCTVGQAAGRDVLRVKGFMFSIGEALDKFKQAFKE